MAYTAPGYTRLILEKLGNRRLHELLESLTEPISGNMYMSSDIWREECRKNNPNDGYLTSSLQSQGPSNPVHGTFGGYCVDRVTGIICDCPDLLQSWIDRPRKYNWPNEDVVREISTMEAHVVPVGYKGSPYQFLEWRICFTKAEIKLIQNFNDCQVKLIVLLKWIAKSYLKPICKEMTSYVMKNLVMWMAEKLPEHYFTEQKLINTLHISLRTLKHCLIRKCFPSYMIADRNLLADRLTDRERSRLCLRIDLLLRDGPQAVIKCGKLRNAFNMLLRSPETFFSSTQRQLQFNILHLLAKYAYLQGWHQLGFTLVCRMNLLFMPDLINILHSGADPITTVWDRINKILS
jgi:hypothetical protein